ncbi:OmpA family protein [Falsiroseomonas oryziterrae]|uniref:OmpA family protein n=1 Tax=Falsiroseomonas oryziterrae TaxID=2911368 RepID=UPI001F2ED36B|nr:OmpA family protein [Roseomonas sp. NPKOSM-4]
MRSIPVAALLVLPVALPAAAQERATGAVTLEQPAPQPRGVIVEQDGRPLTGVVGPGGAVDIRGANVVVIEETPRATKLTVRNDVLFDFDRAELRPEAAEALQRVAELIRQRAPRAVRIVGHTDSVGSDSYNRTLSERRAASVERWLSANAAGLPPLRAEGRGEAEPVAANEVDGRDNPEGRQRNRRVEVLLER